MMAGVFRRRVRGFRLVDVVALALLLVLAFAVYGFKTFAGRESADITDIQRQITQEQKRVRLLRAEIAHLEEPARLARLSTQYLGLKPVAADRETTAEALPALAAAQIAASKAHADAPQTAAAPAPAAPGVTQVASAKPAGAQQP